MFELQFHLQDVTPFTRTGEKAPGYFAYQPGIENTFLIPMRELLKLSEWIAVTAKEEDNSHRDLWQQKERQENMEGDNRLNIKTSLYRKTHGLKLKRPLENAQIERSSSTSREKSVMSGNFDDISSLPQNVIPEQVKSFYDTLQSSNEAPKFSPIWENEWLLPINTAQFFSKIEQGGGFGVGVQGKNNSSYVDASLFALFSFNKTFDSCLHQLKDKENGKLTSRVKKVMRNDIILSLRKEFYVSHDKVLGLCELLGQEILSDCMG